MTNGIKRFLGFATVAALSVGLSGCQANNKEVLEKLDDLNAKVARIEEKMNQAPVAGARPAMPQGQQPGRPDPAAVYAVPVEGSPASGPSDALVTIVKAYEYACPFCLRSNETMVQIKKEYGDKVRIVSKHYVVHPQSATIPALAACAAGLQSQDKFEKMDTLIWEKGFKASRNLSQENMDTLAKEAGLDMNKYKADIEGKCKEMIQKDQSQLAAVGVRGTPAFFINGRPISGAQPFENFKTVIDEEMKKAEAARKAGTKDIYGSLVLEKGKKTL